MTVLQQGLRTDVRTATLVALAAAAPFAVGRLAGGLLVGGGTALSEHVWCPFRAATGVPCPLCGATRSVVLASHGDMAFLSYNPVWVVVLIALAVLGALAALAGRSLPQPRPIVGRMLVGSVVAVAWTCALVHRQAITGI
ncbi:DUF2752 domain-containing protein [Baekduia sp.]|uniref:DUF2752 domain-containing protein n=1 Tax=Baekduia sp. TaxID=2600305 RepID=UPI002E0609BC|nr:DUF2752 domain-containing protein [Baekduia sp.]